MQVMPFWSRVVGDGDPKNYFICKQICAMVVRFAHVHRYGKWQSVSALGRYNGSRGRPEYPNAVLANWKNWEFKGIETSAQFLYLSE